MNLINNIFCTRSFAGLWVLLILGLAVWIGLRASSEPIIDGNLMSLLPTVDRDANLKNAADKVNQHAQRTLILLVSSTNTATSKAAAKTVIESLQRSQIFSDLNTFANKELIGQTGEFYFPLRFHLLSNKARIQLVNGQLEEFERDVLMRYFKPISPLRSDLVENDPLHLMMSFLEERVKTNSTIFESEDGLFIIREKSKTHVLITGVLNKSPFSFQLQDQLMPIINDLNVSGSRNKPGWEIIKAGIFFHAASGTEKAKQEISTVGAGALIGILLLFILVFRSWQPLALSLLSISVGCIGGFAVCITVFGQINLLTLVFGTSLIGISVDYSFHYFCEHLRQKRYWSSRIALGHVFPGISFGLITSIMGFSGLLFTSFPGMRQLAVFSIVGLIFAYISVLTIYPIFTKMFNTDHMDRPLKWSTAYVSFCHSLRGPKAYMVFGLILIVSVIGISLLKPEDDIRHLQSSDNIVLFEQGQIQDLLGDSLSSQFFLVSGKTEDDVLVREEQLIGQLRHHKELGHISGYVALSELVPSRERLTENYLLLTPVIVGEDSLLRRIGQRVGMPDHVVINYTDNFKNSFPANKQLLTDWLATPMAAPYRHLLVGTYNDQLVTAVGLRGIQKTATLQNLAKPSQGITYVDTVNDLSGMFGAIRYQSGWLILGSYFFVGALMFIRYGLRGGSVLMAVPIIAAIVSLGIQGLIGEPLTLFNILAIMLVLGIGVDYGIFFRETGNKHPSTLVAIALSSITTLLAFGLLVLSSTTAVHSFGLTILIGIATAFILSPLSGAYIKIKDIIK